MIIDSSYLFDLMANDPDAFAKGTELVEQGEMQWLPGRGERPRPECVIGSKRYDISSGLRTSRRFETDETGLEPVTRNYVRTTV